MTAKKTHGSGKKKISILRSSTAEYLSFVAAGGNSENSVEMRYEDENIWLTQKLMSALYDVSVPAINQHLKRVFSDNELDENSVVKKYLITASDGKNYNTKHYNLQAIIDSGIRTLDIAGGEVPRFGKKNPPRRPGTPPVEGIFQCLETFLPTFGTAGTRGNC